MNQYVDNIIDAISQVATDADQIKRVRTLAGELNWASDEEIDFLLGQLQPLTAESGSALIESSLEIVFATLVNNQRESETPQISGERLDLISLLYDTLEPESRVRSYLLGWLSSVDDDDSISRFTEKIVNDPPQSAASIVVAFAPLVDSTRHYTVDSLFPDLLDGLQHLSVAAAILDLTNFLTRQRRVDQHPATARLDQLTATLGMLSERLQMLEAGQAPKANTPQQVSQMVNESVALISAMCDALSLIGDPQAIEQLQMTAALRHRRIRTEALSALCHLGDESAADQLVELAGEPIARLRVLSYAEELDLMDKIPAEFQSPEARAQSQLAMWLAHPTNMGLPPNSLDLIEVRQLNWPSYDDPVDCFLFRYQYEFATEKIENIGIAGPLTHAFAFGMSDWEISDVYACFAGWQCAHDDILELSVDQARTQKPGSIERLMSRLSSQVLDQVSIEDVEPSFLGLFMGEEVLVASVSADSLQGTYVVDQQETTWFDAMCKTTGGQDEVAYCIYKGRKLLGAFNSTDDWPGTINDRV